MSLGISSLFFGRLLLSLLSLLLSFFLPFSSSRAFPHVLELVYT